MTFGDRFLSNHAQRFVPSMYLLCQTQDQNIQHSRLYDRIKKPNVFAL